jgi:hypothetical protein
MTKPVRLLSAAVMLLLSGIFLNSCTEDMPILMPISSSVSTKSTVIVNVKNTNSTYSINDIRPSTVVFATTGKDPAYPLYRQYGFDATNNSQTNLLDFAVSFHTDTAGSRRYTLELSQLTVNKKTYSTANIYGNAVFKVEKLDGTGNTATGSFGYFLYDDITSPTDSIYVSGTFNIVK